MGQLAKIDEFKSELSTQKQALESVLPAHIPVARFMRTCMIAVQMNPRVLEADRTSLFNSLQRCAADGLVPDNREAALVEFNTKSGNQWIKKIQYMPMIDGVLKRARQSGEIAVITARAVYENDAFDYWVDENGEHLTHRPKFAGARGDMVMVYAMAKMKSGDVLVEPMTMEDIEKVKNASKTSDKGPWVDWFERMALKSALHRLARRLPNSGEIMEMLDRGNVLYDFDKSRQEKEVNPAQSLAQKLGEAPAPEAQKQPEVDHSGRVNFYLDCLASCGTLDDLEECRHDIEANQNDPANAVPAELMAPVFAEYNKLKNQMKAQA